MSRLRGLDLTTKIILIVPVVVISYLLLFLVMSEVFVQDSTSGTGMMGPMMDPVQTIQFQYFFLLPLH